MSDPLKEMAGRAAADMVRTGMIVGLGTGSTTAYAIRRLGERVRQDGLAIRGIPTSLASEALAREVGIPLVTFDEEALLDVTIDGADEVDPSWNLIKGGGGALLREKVVASRTRREIIIVDPGKLVERLGAFPLPVEVVPFALRPVEEGLRALGGTPLLRMSKTGETYRTDNGNWILDTGFRQGIADPARLERDIDGIPGVLESGLFVGLVHCIVIGRPGGPEIREAPGRGSPVAT